MEAYVVAIRPQQHATITDEFIPSAYDILLLDVKLANNDKTGGNSNSLKQLPMRSIAYEQEPSEALFSLLYDITGKEHGGLKGKRAVFIPPERNEPLINVFSETFAKGTLYCIPIDSRDKLNQKVVENVQHSPSFYSLSEVLNTLNGTTYTYCKQTRLLLHRLENWMREKHKMPGSMDILFSTPTEQRLKLTVTNPAYHLENVPRHIQQYGGSTSDLYNNRSIANEALAKMMSIEKCEITIMNPLFNTGLPFKNKVECSVVNKYWGLGKPDYSKITLPTRHGVKSETIAEEHDEEADSGNNSCDTKENNSKSTSSRESYTISITDRETWAPLEGMNKRSNGNSLSEKSGMSSGKNTSSCSSKERKEMTNLHESSSMVIDNEKLVITDIDSLLEGTAVNGTCEHNWMEEFPMHRYAHEGNAVCIRELLAQGHSATSKDREFWTPIHYAAYNGHLEALETLLYEGKCSPNLTNDHGSTPLHIAAKNGHVYAIELLLKHPNIDLSATDKDGSTALKLCQYSEDADKKACAKLLTRATEKPSPEIQVYLMDGTHRMLSLISGANTTVQQIHQQMMEELDLPENCSHIFTIWICSRNLQLQLKPDHKPIQHLNDWRRKIVPMLTDEDPKSEDPHIFWRRDAILSIEDERKVTDRQAINLLFHEAYHNYIKSLYTCADKDVINLGSILMQLKQGDYDHRKVQNYFASERALQSLIPVAKLPRSGMNWSQQIQQRYLDYSKSLNSKNKSPQILQQHFLMLCWNLVVYGSAFFTGQVQIKSNKSLDTVYIGVNDIGAHIVHGQRKTMMNSCKYNDIDWETRNKMTLEIRQKGSAKGRLSIITKQAGLIHHLMSKLAQLNVGKNS